MAKKATSEATSEYLNLSLNSMASKMKIPFVMKMLPEWMSPWQSLTLPAVNLFLKTDALFLMKLLTLLRINSKSFLDIVLPMNSSVWS